MTLQKMDLPKWCYLLIMIYCMPEEKRYNERLLRRLNISISHARAILEVFSEENLITTTKKGRVKYIQLTEKGNDIAHKIWPIVQEFRKPEKAERFLFPPFR